MIENRAQLEGMKMVDLKHLALQMGTDPSQPSETKEALIERLLVVNSLQPEQEKKPEDAPTEPETPKAVFCTIKQVKDAVNPFILRGMKVFYDKETNCWLFRVKLKSYNIRDANTGEIRVVERWRDDSGTLNQPLATIRRCASVLMQGVSKPENAKPEFDPAASYETVA